MGVIQDALVVRLTKERDEAIRDRDELQAVFDLQWTRSREADAMWKAAHPGTDVDIPDLGVLLQWMMNLIRAAAPVMMSLAMTGERWDWIYQAELERLEKVGDPISLARKRGLELMADPEKRAIALANLKHMEEKDDPMGPE